MLDILDVSTIFSAPEYKRTTVKAIQVTEEGNVYIPYYEGGVLMGLTSKFVSSGMWILEYSSGVIRVMQDDEFRREFELAVE